MNLEEWASLTNDEVLKMSNEIFLKNLIRFTEERYIDYKKNIENLYKEKNNIDENFFEWFNRELKDFKNIEERNLKRFQLELTHEKCGMNPPYCYNY